MKEAFKVGDLVMYKDEYERRLGVVLNAEYSNSLVAYSKRNKPILTPNILLKKVDRNVLKDLRFTNYYNEEELLEKQKEILK